MRHYLLTRSAFDPAVWDLDANRRRLAVTRAVTARLMAQQTNTNWTWGVLLDERDPLLKERMAVFRDHAPRFEPIVWLPPDKGLPPDTSRARQRLAAADYNAPWRTVIGEPDDVVLTTRLDDDDGFVPDVMARYQAAARKITTRTALMLPIGIRVWQGRYEWVRHPTNAMHTLVSPPGDIWHVYDYGHTKVRQRVGRPVTVDQRPAWFWFRHPDTISDWHFAKHRLTPDIRRMFPVNWAAIT